MILVIDNYDSFVYNLVQYLGEMGENVSVVRNDMIDMQRLFDDPPTAIIVSPGPGIPRNAGMSCEVIKACAGQIPIFGVCLGHQAIAAVFGGCIKRAPRVVHGKTSFILHDGSGIFTGIENPLAGTRYHSLIVDRETLPACLHVSAWTEDGLVMAIRHKGFMIEGVQFHPESVVTRSGKRIIENFVKGAKRGHSSLQQMER